MCYRPTNLNTPTVCPVPLTRNTVSGTHIETTLLSRGLDSVLYIHTLPLFQVELEKRLGIGGHALLSWCPKIGLSNHKLRSALKYIV